MTDDLSRRTGDLSPEKLALLVLRMKKKRAAEGQAGKHVGVTRRVGSGPAPLSFGQQRLWLLDRLEPGSTAYNMPSPIRLRGALDRSALERALGEIVRRHESLRTTFADREDEPVQVVLPPAGFHLPLADLSGLPAEVRDVEARRILIEDKRPFDLERGPLF